MAAGDTMQGDRVADDASVGTAIMDHPGAYLLRPARRDMWMCLPNGAPCHIYVDERGVQDGAIWGVTVHEDDTVTVSPSIWLKPTPGIDGGWHGYLERGVWREV